MFIKRIGILTGNGAAAGAYLYSKLIDLAQTRFGCIEDGDFPEVILINSPTGDLDEKGYMNLKKASQLLANNLNWLDKHRCELKIVACNTIHTIFHGLPKKSTSGLIDMVDLAVKEAEGCESVAVLCSEYLATEGLYDRKLARAGVKSVKLSKLQQNRVNELILKLMGGKPTDVERAQFDQLIMDLLRKDAQKIIVGCTELSIIAGQSGHKGRLIDAVEVSCFKVLTDAWC